tara:strand:+ start:97 stop:852 length:756 start_codon:yes stop_codon:yes gene_type:complete
MNKLRKIQEFARYEFKYIITNATSNAIEAEVKNFMQSDNYASQKIDNAYYVRSQYYDNDLSSHFYEKVDGMRDRYKYRIRTYGPNQSHENPIFLEKKGRKLERTFKQRYQIDHENLEIFYNPFEKEKLLQLYPNIDLIREFVFDSIRKSITPRIIVDYLRTPYVSNFDSNFRLTFDRSMTVTQTNDNYKLYQRTHTNLKVAAGYTILEMKFFRRFPPWFHKIIQTYNLRRLSISKFSTGMEYCGIAKDTGL